MAEVQGSASKAEDQGVAQGGAYEVIRKRLDQQAAELSNQCRELNQARMDEFGSKQMELIARVRVRTENNCVARDIVQVGRQLLFGYNVFIGLKNQTAIGDVFSLFELEETEEGGAELKTVPVKGSFLADPTFQSDFRELYTYYKQARLIQLTSREGKVLAVFQIGNHIDDIRVFRWSVSPDGNTVRYIDARGEPDLKPPSAYDFEWTELTRNQMVQGRFTHYNVADRIFIETTGGDLTVKVENNTESGLGIYSEPVDDATQALDDASLYYALVGDLILLKVLPYRESVWRYLVFNSNTNKVVRIDAIGQSCLELPEDHGIIFPGGYLLATGEHKMFPDTVDGLKFKRLIKSPNGEDTLYVFYEKVEGLCALMSYNMINKSLQNPMYGHGYAVGQEGRLVIFNAESEPTRIHPMQVWDTQFFNAEHASRQPARNNFYGRIGNAELVRGISAINSLIKLLLNQEVTSSLYEEIVSSAARLFDAYYWLAEQELASLSALLKQVEETAELVLDEFEKVQSIRAKAAEAMQQAEAAQKEILRASNPDPGWKTPAHYVDALKSIRTQRGHLLTIKGYRYIDVDRIAELEASLVEAGDRLGLQTVEFLAGSEALAPYHARITEFNASIEKVETVTRLQPTLEEIGGMADGLDLLSELVSSLKVDDATLRTRIIDAITEVYAKLNQCKAAAGHKRKSLGSSEAVAQFGAQFKLLGQSVENALGMSTTPEKCDEQLSRLLVQLEELEGQFSEHDRFLNDILAKREEIYESFEAHKQSLLDERQRRTQNLIDAADRILQGIDRRAGKFTEEDDLNTYLASDAMVLKVHELVAQLRSLESSVKADDVESRFKGIKDQALRALRDKSDIYEDGGNVIKLGPRHRFSVSQQELDLTLIPREGGMFAHLSGTDFYQRVDDQALYDLKPYWDMGLESETPEVYRAEYLAYAILEAMKGADQTELDVEALRQALADTDALLDVVRGFAVSRYKEGYTKGIHDHDAALILQKLVPAVEMAGLLRFDPQSRALACVFWDTFGDPELKTTWKEQAVSAAHMQQIFGEHGAQDLLVGELTGALREFVDSQQLGVEAHIQSQAGRYLAAELASGKEAFVVSRYGVQIARDLEAAMGAVSWAQFQQGLARVRDKVLMRWNLARSWLDAMVSKSGNATLQRYIPEAIATILCETSSFSETAVELELKVDNLMGDHQRIEDRQLTISVDEFLSRLDRHVSVVVPAYHAYLILRQDVADREKATLRLGEFKPRPLTSFVRNKLINDAYLPIIGDNLAKQMGTVGDDKRTDLMGLLMMISPPGYGKTTLMEYVANRLGLIFMKINCPSLGHDVLSLDPEQAPNATARQELVKLNLGLEMGNNVMLYLDDIQHTNPEFLQKFISLCDGTRRIEGVWKGKTRTYDMRGKKFCVVMAGNPYTESGDVFRIPDMLANRADIYNLGDILGGMDEQFELSYIENSLTSNRVLAQLATRDMNDLYKLVDMARTGQVSAGDLKHGYSGAEVNEIVDVLGKMFIVRDVVLKVNKQYIISAAQADKYRTEPPFKLQGSYRNMNKMAEKISSVMTTDEIHAMVRDHYLGEAQLLTSGAEENLLKLGELLGNLTETDVARWEQIKTDFRRNQSMGGDDADGSTRIANQVAIVSETLGRIHDAGTANDSVQKSLASLADSFMALKTRTDDGTLTLGLGGEHIESAAKVLKHLAQSLSKMTSSVNSAVEFDKKILREITELASELRAFSEAYPIKRKAKGKAAHLGDALGEGDA